jgi:hypothetical protein
MIRAAIAHFGWFDSGNILPGDNPALWFAGDPLFPGARFQDYSVPNGVTLHFTVRYPYTVFVTLLTGKQVTFEASPSDTVGLLKRSIEDSAGIPAREQGLICGGKQLEDEPTLRHYNVKRDAILHVLLRLR